MSKKENGEKPTENEPQKPPASGKLHAHQNNGEQTTCDLLNLEEHARPCLLCEVLVPELQAEIKRLKTKITKLYLEV